MPVKTVARTKVRTLYEADADLRKSMAQIALTDTEMNADFICVSGKSNSANTVVYPAFIQTERGDLNAILNRLDNIEGAIPQELSNLPTMADLNSVKTDILSALSQSHTGLSSSISGVGDTIAQGVKLNNSGKSDVKEQTLAAINGGTISELTALPGANPTLAKAVMLLYMALRNKTINGEDITQLHKSDGTPLATAYIHGDNNVFTKDVFNDA